MRAKATKTTAKSISKISVKPASKLASKRDRMHLRLDLATKHKLERAAAYEQKSITEFVLSQALEAADEVLKSHEQHVLSVADWETFCKALDRPPKPSRALKAGFRWYRAKTA